MPRCQNTVPSAFTMLNQFPLNHTSIGSISNDCRWGVCGGDLYSSLNNITLLWIRRFWCCPVDRSGGIWRSATGSFGYVMLYGGGDFVSRLSGVSHVSSDVTAGLGCSAWLDWLPVVVFLGLSDIWAATIKPYWAEKGPFFPEAWFSVMNQSAHWLSR